MNKEKEKLNKKNADLHMQSLIKDAERKAKRKMEDLERFIEETNKKREEKEKKKQEEQRRLDQLQKLHDENPAAYYIDIYNKVREAEKAKGKEISETIDKFLTKEQQAEINRYGRLRNR